MPFYHLEKSTLVLRELVKRLQRESEDPSVLQQDQV